MVDADEYPGREEVPHSELALEEISGVGESFADALRAEGIETAYDLLHVDIPENLSNNTSLFGRTRARQIYESAHDRFDELWDDKQFDAGAQRYFDAGPDKYQCACGNVYDEENIFEVHRSTCKVARSGKASIDLVVDLEEQGFDSTDEAVDVINEFLSERASELNAEESMEENREKESVEQSA